MKKVVLLSIVVVLLTILAGCSRVKSWSDEQRMEFLAMLSPYREMIYLNELSDEDFTIFTGNVSSGIEVAYPVYAQFVIMPSLQDTVDMWVVTTIAEELDTDASNMRYLYPYNTLVMQGVLPAGLDHDARKSFYRCFAQKVNAKFSSLEAFFYAVITNAIEPDSITTMQRECAADLFNYTAETCNKIIMVG